MHDTVSARQAPRPFRFTGWHMTAIMVAFFGVVFAVNIYLAKVASASFSGEVVANSFDASQRFNRWLDDAHRDATLGWNPAASRDGQGRLVIAMTTRGSVALPPARALEADVTHPLGTPDARTLRFASTAQGTYVSTEPLGPGRWQLRLRLNRTAPEGVQDWRAELAL